METQSSIASRVHVIDADAHSRSGLMHVLTTSGLHVAEYGSAAEFLLAARAGVHGCVLVDIAPRGIDGIELMKRMQPQALAPPFILVSTSDDVAATVAAMKSGAIDCIVKPARSELIVATVRKAIEVDGPRRELRKLRARFESLTPAECVILFRVAEHKLNKQIAAELGVCERTVKSQRARMMDKLRIATVPEVVRTVALLEKTDSHRNASCVHGADRVTARGSSVWLPEVQYSNVDFKKIRDSRACNRTVFR